MPLVPSITHQVDRLECEQTDGQTKYHNLLANAPRLIKELKINYGQSLKPAVLEG